MPDQGKPVLDKPKEDPKLTLKEMEILIFNKTNELKKKYLAQGPFVYELYGVMLHSGGAHGGHYSAYIKDIEGFEEELIKDRTPEQIN